MARLPSRRQKKSHGLCSTLVMTRVKHIFLWDAIVRPSAFTICNFPVPQRQVTLTLLLFFYFNKKKVILKSLF